MYIVTVEFDLHSEYVEEFRRAVTRQASTSLHCEAECRQFDVCFSGDSPMASFLYEKYDSKAAFDEHLTTEHFAAFNRTVAPWVNNKLVRTWRMEESPL